MNLKNMSFTAKVAASAGVLASLLLLAAWYGLHTAGSLRESFTYIVGTKAKALELAGTINTAESNMAAGQRGLVAFTFGKEADHAAGAKQTYRASLETLRAALSEIKPLIDTDHGKKLLETITSNVNTWDGLYTEVQREADAGDAEGAMKGLLGITATYKAIGDQCDELSQLQRSALDAANKEAGVEYQSARMFLIGFIVLGALTAMGALAMVRSASSQLRQVAVEMFEGSRQVAAASGQVAAASQSLAQGTSEQAATLEETSSSTSEITAITRKNAENTRTVAGHMDETAKLVQEANQNLGAMMESMKDINSSSERISKIIRVIDEIAFQTNILALNAAVEAARAGEAGMGFAVVADEVRNLAQRSAQAAKDTAALIEESIGKSGEGSRKLELVARSIQQITGSANQVKTLVDEVHVGSQEQARGIEQIGTAVGQMEQVTQRSAANAEESASASEELAGQAQSLYASVERLRLIVGGQAESGRSNAAPVGMKPAPTRGLAALGSSLRAANGPNKAMVAAHQAFPLDENEQSF